MPRVMGSVEKIYVQLNHPKLQRGSLQLVLNQDFGFCALSCDRFPGVFSRVSRILTTLLSSAASCLLPPKRLYDSMPSSSKLLSACSGTSAGPKRIRAATWIEEGKYTAKSGFTENFKELENTPAITMSLILEIIHSFRIMYAAVFTRSSLATKPNEGFFFFFNEQPQIKYEIQGCTAGPHKSRFCGKDPHRLFAELPKLQLQESQWQAPRSRKLNRPLAPDQPPWKKMQHPYVNEWKAAHADVRRI